MTRLRTSIARFLRAIEPWYDWGRINIVNLDARTYHEQREGEVRFFDLQWFGIHIGLQFGRTPPAAASAEIQSRKAWRERAEAQGEFA